MKLSNIFGRKFLLRRMLNYAENNMHEFKVWMNDNIDVPGLSEEQEAELIDSISMTTISTLRAMLDGVGVDEMPVSKRLVMTHIARWVAELGSTWAKAVKLPFISAASDDAIDALIVSLINNDLMAFIEAKF